MDIDKLNPKPEIINFKTSDGLILVGWYFKTQQKPKGLIVHFHGNAQNVSTHFFNLWKVGDIGYDYFIFDYRGYGFSQGKPNPKGTVLDGLAALKWAKEKQEERKAKDLVVFCQSLGGPICMKSLAEQNEVHPTALVIDSSFYSYRSAARGVARSSWLVWPFQPIAWLMVDNSESPIDDLHNLKAKQYLVVHGQDDRVISFSNGKRLFEKLPEPKELWEIPHGQHTDFLFNDNGKYRIKFYTWLNKL
ncbi:MAG: alpha/beta hydrolase [Bdellovibrionaceae bacterium]|nr:alpha/beta hydrolase [Pseudobdellovibrionaceae bacterium]